MEPKCGDVLNVERGIVVHGCNAQGVMGSGIARSVKDRYPKAFFSYRRQYENSGELKVGDIIPVEVSEDKWIVNAITQRFYGRDGRRYVDYDGVRSCFLKVAALAKENNLPVFYPLIGCDLGGGDWEVVSKIISEELKDVEHALFLLPGKSLPLPSKPAQPRAFGRSR